MDKIRATAQAELSDGRSVPRGEFADNVDLENAANAALLEQGRIIKVSPSRRREPTTTSEEAGT